MRKIPFLLGSTYTFGQIWWQPVATGTRLNTLMFTSGALSYDLCTKIGKSSRNLEIASKIVPKLLCLEAECPKPRNTPGRNDPENLATGKVEKTNGRLTLTSKNVTILSVCFAHLMIRESHVFPVLVHAIASLRASSPIWANKTICARTRKSAVTKLLRQCPLMG